MGNLKTVRGNIGIMVWRRSSWISMPHMYVNSSYYITECGRDIVLGNGIVAITLTTVPVDMFTVVGCSHCTQTLLRDLKHELLRKNMKIHSEYKAKLKTVEWYRSDDTPRT